jgi:hypothetical protein
MGEVDPPRKPVSRSSPAAAVQRAAPPDPVSKQPDFDLQAIAWSKVPERRLAVINGRVVREGASLRAFRVLRINRDAVDLSDGQSSLRLVFRRDAASPLLR